MNRIRQYEVTAVVLRGRDQGEADRLVTLLSAERGKLTAVVRGARRPRSKLAAGMQPFNLCTVQLAVGRTWDVVTQVQIINPFYSLREDLARLAYASYFAELVDASVEPDGGARETFDLLAAALKRLDRGDMAELLARAFELRLMGALGWEPRLNACVVCEGAVEAEDARFSPAAGGMVCAECRTQATGGLRLSPPTLAALQMLQRGGEAALRQKAARYVLRELELALRRYIEYRLERPLRSARLLREVTRPRPARATVV